MLSKIKPAGKLARPAPGAVHKKFLLNFTVFGMRPDLTRPSDLPRRTEDIRRHGDP